MIRTADLGISTHFMVYFQLEWRFVVIILFIIPFLKINKVAVFSLCTFEKNKGSPWLSGRNICLSVRDHWFPHYRYPSRFLIKDCVRFLVQIDYKLPNLSMHLVIALAWSPTYKSKGTRRVIFIFFLVGGLLEI